ncbi:hypothetical protein I553_6542 [Mycobacterium xenopi 4042]|uniref:Uncharacterized protein n=1 Tax=Mycobacterium xenopi 4042 TaxID=1299334 RepID=X8BEX5_MYCXE|nr:hypothetical protein I553_6542 [Mycobacterium xenopi 4042]
MTSRVRTCAALSWLPPLSPHQHRATDHRASHQQGGGQPTGSHPHRRHVAGGGGGADSAVRTTSPAASPAVGHIPGQRRYRVDDAIADLVVHARAGALAVRIKRLIT